MLPWLLPAIGLLLGFGYCYARYVAPQRLELVEFDFASPHLPDDLNGRRILHITDVHITAGGAPQQLRRVLATVEPDLICMTGDLVGYRDAVPAAIDLVRLLVQHAPLWIVFGNHENGNYIDSAALGRRMEAAGAQILHNRSSEHFMRDGARLRIAGVDDPHSGRASVRNAFADVRPGEFTLFLAHSPDAANAGAESGADLILCGHTHGGQVRVPWLGPLTTNTFHTPRRAASGFTPLNARTAMYVSRGVGVTAMRIRLFCSPEVTLITLRCAPEGSPVAVRNLRSRRAEGRG